MPLARLLCRCAWFALALAIWAPTAAQAQVGLPDSFNSAAGSLDGTVRAMLTQSDGKIIVVGDFTTVSGTPRGRIARFNPDGTLDATFAAGAGANGPIRAIVAGASGFYIGGDFTSFDQTAHTRVARLTSAGAVDSSFSPNAGPNGPVYALSASPYRSTILIGGDFTQVGSLTRNRLALLNSSTGALHPSYFSNPAGVNGTVHTILSYSSYDNSCYIGGAFTSVNGSARNYVARFNNYGDLDPYFNGGATSGPNGPVYTMAADFSNDYGSFSGNNLYLGGSFTSVGGAAHARLAIVDSDSGAPNGSFTLGADGPVRSLSLQTDSTGSSATSIMVGGDFTQINYTAQARVGRLINASSQSYPYTASWNVDLSFNAGTGADAAVLCLGAESDGKTFIGGDFTSVNGAARAHLARLYGDGGANPPARPAQPVVGAGTNTQLVVVWSGVNYVTGYRIERSADGATGWTQVSPANGSPSYPFIDGALSPSTPYYYRVVAYSTNGESAPSPVGNGATLAAPWTAAGALDAPFAVAAAGGSSVSATALQPDGKILVAGYRTIAGAARYLFRLNPDGSLDGTFDSGSGASSITTVALQSDGKILVGGSFSTFNNQAHPYLVRLNSDGSTDSSFSQFTGLGSPFLADIAVQPDGKIFITGYFSTVNGSSRNGIARLNPDGSLDPAFNPNPGLSFANGYGLALQPDGKVIVHGFFQTANGINRGNLARFNADGTLDTGFATGAGADFIINAAEVMADGRVVIVGNFSTYNGVKRRGVARLLADGSLDTSFDPGLGSSSADQVAVQPDGKVVISGYFAVVSGAVREHVARLNADGTLDATFQPGLGADGSVQSLLLQTDGKVVLGGYFSTFNGASVPDLARVLADNGSAAPAAPDSLHVTTLASNRISLAWANVAWESGYIVEESPDGTSGWAGIAVTAVDTPAFTAIGLNPGSKHFYRVRAYSTNGSSAPSLTLSATAYTAYQQWKVDSGLPADAPDNGDADGDGLSNLVEYAVGSAPNSAASHNVPTLATNGPRLELHYTRARSDVTYLVQSSTDLATWSAADVDQGSAGPAVTASTPLGATRKFLRLVVSAPQ